MSKTIVSIILLTVVGCTVIDGVFPVNAVFEDLPEQEQIVVTYQNNTNRTVCLSPASWPTPQGVIDNGSDRIALVIEEERFPMRDVNTDYCPKCATVAPPGAVVSATVPYKMFELPKSAGAKTKELVYTPTAFFCNEGDVRKVNVD